MKSTIRAQISNAENLALTLRYLASGQSVLDVSIYFRVGHTTAQKIILEVCQAIGSGLASWYVRCPSTLAQWAAVSDDFSRRRNFLHCIGGIDGKHIKIQPPFNAGSSFFNHKNFHSIVPLTVVDAQYKFLIIDAGSVIWPA